MVRVASASSREAALEIARRLNTPVYSDDEGGHVVRVAPTLVFGPGAPGGAPGPVELPPVGSMDRVLTALNAVEREDV